MSEKKKPVKHGKPEPEAKKKHEGPLPEHYAEKKDPEEVPGPVEIRDTKVLG